ncbi:hypothetical protein VKT23_009246 [Stygiomarasmius scandens]|uniref:Mug135-like C-terminal domain-containing protein n=1 Tax=Marasmiellus scandens TaxID=2682957 RepID=A0ABR1JEV0_9AGAR
MAVSDDELTKVEVYSHPVVASGAAPPPWLQQALDSLQQTLDQRLKAIERLAAISYNATAGDGLRYPWHVVTFADGTHPVNDRHLTELTNVESINALDQDEVRQYCIGYNIQIPDTSTIDEKRRRIAAHIGCRVLF